MQHRRRGRIKPHDGWVRATTLHQASVERWKDARALLAADRPHGAVYMAGYVLECTVKCVAIQRIGKTYLEEWEADLGGRRGRRVDVRGQKGHDLRYLLECAGLDREVFADPELQRVFLLVSRWTVGMRYQALPGSVDDAEDFLRAVEVIRSWLRGKV